MNLAVAYAEQVAKTSDLKLTILFLSQGEEATIWKTCKLYASPVIVVNVIHLNSGRTLLTCFKYDFIWCIDPTLNWSFCTQPRPSMRPLTTSKGL